MPNLPDEGFLERIADAVDLTQHESAPSRLKAKVYSALVLRQAETGPLSSLTETVACGHDLCVFEELVRIAPVGEGAKSLNFCRVCHARVLAEQIENAPIYWSGCPYVKLKNS
ncbi:MAG: hypothetical protein WA609_03060 [Terriglobales bacterium]